MSIQEIPIPKPSRLIKQQAEATIQSLIDAIVELVTNSDDSYKRLENIGEAHFGEIEIYVAREKGGRVKEFYIKDFAEGMSREKLEKAIAYGEEASGFTEGKSVRGLLGRGLKEAILGLGDGEIFTIKDNVLNIAKIWWDSKERKALYEILEDRSNYNFQLPEIEEFIRKRKNGTLIRIKVKNEKIKIPEYEGFKTQISNHYALRDINSSKRRNLRLVFVDLKKRGSRNEVKIEFQEPEGKLVFDETIKIPKYGDKIQLKIKEALQPLTNKSPRYEPWSKAGILIKIRGAILDNQLFRFENDPASYYFFGEAYCEGIFYKIQEGIKEYKETEIIDEKRKGLNWHSSYCQAVQKAIEKVIDPLIQKKKKELEERVEKAMPRSRKEFVDKISDILSQLAKKEFKEWEGPVEPPEKIEKLTVIPPQANLELNRPKLFAIYAPKELIKEKGEKISISSDSNYVKILVPHSKRLVLYLNETLKPHPKKSDTWYGSFKAVGKEIKKETFIYCKLGDQWVNIGINVIEPRVIKKEEKKEKKKKKGGLFSEINPDSTFNPTQRSQYIKETGEIKIYINFPGVREYLGPRFKGIETKEGKVIFAEIIGEIFCRTMAQEKIERGQTPYPSGAGPDVEIPAFLATLNEFQKKYLDKIHKAIFNYKFK